MPGGVPWLSVAHFLTVLVAVGVLWHVWSARDRPGATVWVAVASLIAASTCLYGVALLIDARALRALLEAVTLTLVVWTGFFYFTFALSYTGRAHHFRTTWFRGLVVLHGCATALLLSNPVHHLLLSDVRVTGTFGAVVVAADKEPLLFGLAALVYLTVGAGIVMLVQTVVRYGPSFRRQALAVGLSPLFAIAASLVWLFEVGPYPNLNLIALGLLPAVLLDAYALFGREMLELPPGLRRAGERAALDDLGSPVFIVAEDGRIIDVNSAAEAVFATDRDVAIAESLSHLLGSEIELREDEQRIRQLVRGERRTFKLVLSPFETKSGLHRGFTVIMQDVTTEIQRKQRLEVLNRILRHNLRNDLNVVQLHAQQLELSLSDPEELEHVAEIDAVSADLIGLGEKARWATQALDDASYREIDLRNFLESVAEEVQSIHPAAVVEVDLADDAVVTSDPDVLGLIFTSLVENAIEHNPTDEPTVSIAVNRPDGSSDSVRIRVSDDGPGIPEHERRVIEHGEETALDHGSGIGLWLVHWGVTTLGGDVDFDVDEAGTTVSIRLPAGTE